MEIDDDNTGIFHVFEILRSAFEVLFNKRVGMIYRVVKPGGETEPDKTRSASLLNGFKSKNL